VIRNRVIKLNFFLKRITKSSLFVQVFDEILEPSRFVVLLDGFLGSKFKIGLLLGDAGNFLFLCLFFGKNNLGFSRLRSILLFMGVTVRDGSEFSEVLSSFLTSGLVVFESSNNSLSSLVGSEEFLAAKSGDVGVEFDHDTQVLQRVLLSGSLDGSMLRRIDLALDLAGGDKAVEIGVSNKRSW